MVWDLSRIVMVMQCAYTLLVVGACHWGDDQAKVVAEIEAALARPLDAVGADGRQEVILAYGRLFEEVSRQQISTLCHSRSASVSLQAAWRRVDLFSRRSDGGYRVDRGAIEYFLGLRSGRIGIPPPNWWESAVRDAQHADGLVKRLAPGGAMDFEGHLLTVPALRGPVDFRASAPYKTEVYGSTWWLKVDGVKRPVMSLAELEASYNASDSLAAVFSSNRSYLVMAGPSGSRFTIMCRDVDGKPVWQAAGWGNAYWGGGTGISVSTRLEVALTEREVYVFGLTPGLSAFMEGFHSDTGVPIVRFSTFYYPVE